MATGDISTIQAVIEVKKGLAVSIADAGINVNPTNFDIKDISIVETSRSGNIVFMNLIVTVVAKT